MRTKIIAALAAGGLLIGAGLVTSIVSAPSVASAQEESVETEEKSPFQRGFELLSGVLSDLVSSGDIEQSDADKVLAAVEAKADEIRANREALREQIQEFLEDGVLTSAEAGQLPDDHPFNSERFDEAWEDGQLTTEEIREARPHPRRDWFKRGARLGALLDDGGIDQDEYNEVLEHLPEDHWLNDVDIDEYFEDDDLITRDELGEIWQEWHEPLFDDSAA